VLGRPDSPRRPNGGLVTALLLLCCVAIGAACGPSSSSTSTTKKLKIAFFNPIQANTYTTANFKGVQDAAKEVGADPPVQFDAGFDANKQARQMQDAITTGKYNTFVVDPVDGSVDMPVTQQAKDAGITVIAIGSNIASDLAATQPGVPGTYFIGYAPGQNGVQLGQLMVQACADKNPCNVVYMPADLRAANENVRKKAVEDFFKATPNVKLIGEPPSGFDAPSGLKAGQDLVTAHSTGVDVIGGSAGQAMIGALPAFKDAGWLGKVKIVANGGTVEECKYIRDGTLFGAVVHLPYTDGKLAVHEAQDKANGKTVQAFVDEATISPIGTKLATQATLSTAQGQKFTGEYTDT
jgi:ribose transport system substrate-binding protein